VVLLYIILIWWGDFFGVFGETSEMGGGSFNVVNLGFGGGHAVHCRHRAWPQQDPKHNFQWEQADWPILG